jgi:hypothetical protein
MMFKRFMYIVTLATLFAFLMIFATHNDPPGAVLSAPAFGAGVVGAAPAASPKPSASPVASAAPAAPSPTPAPSGPASDKQDGPLPSGVTAPVGESWDVRHTPSVDAATIRTILQKYNSPAVGASDAMYQLGIEYGIDPAFCLAFFINESTAGTAGVARTTKSVGNIRTTPGYTDYQGYRKYESWEQGIEDWYRLIRDLYIADWNLTTVDQIIPVYAPTSDGNNPDHYIATVKKLVSSWRGTR